MLAEDGLVAMSSADAGTIGCGRPGELAEGVGEKRKRIRVCVPCGTTEHRSERAGADWIRVVLVADVELRTLSHDLELACIEHATVLISQDRNEHGVAESRLGRLPFHVEVRGEVTRRPVFEHIGPPPVGRGGDRHVVRHDVEDLPHLHVLQCGCKTPESFFAAQFHVRTRVVDNVVAVRASGRRLKIGRAERVRDAQFGEVVADSSRGVEWKVGVKLKTIGCRQVHSAFGAKQIERHDGGVNSAYADRR